MLPAMKRRTTFVRFLALTWATLQLASPAISAIADGLLARENGSRPSTHVEATTRDTCPVIHAPDCAVCRYLSGSGCNDASAPAFGWSEAAQSGATSGASTMLGSAAIALPHGRGPPEV